MRDVSNYQTENSTLYNKRLYNENSNDAVSLSPISCVVCVGFDSWRRGVRRDPTSGKRTGSLKTPFNIFGQTLCDDQSHMLSADL